MFEGLKFWKNKKEGYVSLREIERVLGEDKLEKLVQGLSPSTDEVEVIEVEVLEEILGKDKTEEILEEAVEMGREETLEKKEGYWKISEIMDYLDKEDRGKLKDEAHIRDIGKVSVEQEMEFVK